VVCTGAAEELWLVEVLLVEEDDDEEEEEELVEEEDECLRWPLFRRLVLILFTFAEVVATGAPTVTH